jgi:hypothetical protein
MVVSQPALKNVTSSEANGISATPVFSLQRNSHSFRLTLYLKAIYVNIE